MTVTNQTKQAVPQEARKGLAAPIPVIENLPGLCTSSEYKAFVGSLQCCDKKDFTGISQLRSSSEILMANQRHALIRAVGCLHGNTLIQRAVAEKESSLFESYRQELQILIAAGEWKEIPRFLEESGKELTPAEFSALWEFGVQGYSRILTAEMRKAVEAGDKQLIINLSHHPLSGQLPLQYEDALADLASKGLFRIYQRQIQEAQEAGNKLIIYEAMDRMMTGLIKGPEVDVLHKISVKGIGKIYKKEMLDAVQMGNKDAILKAYEGVVVGMVQDEDIEQMRSMATYGLRKLGEEELAGLIEDPDLSKITKKIRPDFKTSLSLAEFSAETDEWIRQQLPEVFPPPETVESQPEGRQQVGPQPTGRAPVKKPIKNQPVQQEEWMSKHPNKPSVEIKPYGSGRVGILVDGKPVFWGGFYSPIPEDPIQIKRVEEGEGWDKSTREFALPLSIWHDYAILEFVPGFKEEAWKNGFILSINLFTRYLGKEEETQIFLSGENRIVRQRKQQDEKQVFRNLQRKENKLETTLASEMKAETKGELSLGTSEASFNSIAKFSTNGNFSLDLAPLLKLPLFSLGSGARIQPKNVTGFLEMNVGSKLTAFSTGLTVDEAGNLSVNLGSKFIFNMLTVSTKVALGEKKSLSSSLGWKKVGGIEGLDINTALKYSISQAGLSPSAGIEYTTPLGERTSLPVMKLGAQFTYQNNLGQDHEAVFTIYLKFSEKEKGKQE